MRRNYISFYRRLFFFDKTSNTDVGKKIDVVKLFSLYSTGVITKNRLRNLLRGLNPEHRYSSGTAVVIPYKVLIHNSVLNDYGVSDINFETKLTFQKAKQDVRVYLKALLKDMAQGHPEEPLRFFNRKTGKSEIFDPMNKRHLLDSEIELVPLHNF